MHMKSLLLAGVAAAYAGTAAAARTISIPGDAPTIQQGIDAASPGDTVLLSPGTYTGPLNRDLDFRGKAITVRGSVDAQGRCASVLFMGGDGRGFFFHGGEGPDSVLSTVIVRWGLGTDGGAIACIRSSPTIDGCIVEGSEAGRNGGGIYCEGGSPTIRGCTIRDNNAETGGGLYVSPESAPLVLGCTFEGNGAYTAGGGIYTAASGCTIASCTISGGRAGYGGGIAVEGAPAPIEEDGDVAPVRPARCVISNCRVADNYAESQGGGIFCRNDQSGTVISDCAVERNDSGDEGGGIWCEHSSPVIKASRIGSNSSGYGGGVYFSHGSSPLIQGCDIGANSSVFQGGGIWGTGSVRLFSSAVHDNKGLEGAGLYVEYLETGWCVVRDSSFSRNSASGMGGGICSLYNAMDLQGCSFTGNTSGRAGGGVIYYMEDDARHSVLSRCTFAGNRAGGDGGGLASVNGDMEIAGCVFTGNAAGREGGGAFFYSGIGVDRYRLSGCTFTGNTAVSNGGGLFCDDVGLQMIDSALVGNSSQGSGGGLWLYSVEDGSGSMVRNCTIRNNSAAGLGSGIYSLRNASYENAMKPPRIVNTIVWGNTDRTDGKGHRCYQLYGEAEVDHDGPTSGNLVLDLANCDVQYGERALGMDATTTARMKGCISADPKFTDSFHIDPSSPCIARGDPSYVAPGEVDIDGEPRLSLRRLLFGPTVEIGADQVR